MRCRTVPSGHKGTRFSEPPVVVTTIWAFALLRISALRAGTERSTRRVQIVVTTTRGHSPSPPSSAPQIAFFLVEQFGKAGNCYYDIARAKDNKAVETNRIRKSIGAENSFAEYLVNKKEIITKNRCCPCLANRTKPSFGENANIEGQV